MVQPPLEKLTHTALEQGRNPEPEREGGGGQLELCSSQLGRVPKPNTLPEPLVQGRAAGNLPPHEWSHNTSVCLSSFIIGHSTLGK